MDTIVRLEDVSFSYGDRLVLRDLRLDLAQGQILSLLGPNGAGKTTTAELMEGYMKPAAGSVLIFGENPAVSRSIRSAVGVMLQKPGIYPALRTKEVIRLFGAYHSDRMPVEEVLSLTGLDRLADAKVRTLSGGELQRLSLGLALVGKPKLLILDEPTSGMDPVARASIWDHLQHLARSGTSIFLTTHSLDEAEYLSDRVAILHKGRIVIEGPPNELTSHRRGFEFRVEPPIPIGSWPADLAAGIEEIEPGRYRAAADATPELIARLTGSISEQGALLSEMKTRSSLEDVYLQALETNESS